MNKLCEVLGFIVIVIIAFGWGFLTGSRQEIQKVGIYKGEIAGYTAAAIANKQEKEAQNEAQNKIVEEQYDQYSDKLDDYLMQLHEVSNNGQHMSEFTGCAKSTNNTTGQFSSTCNCINPDYRIVKINFYQGCLHDTLELFELQNWLERQQFPIES